MKTFDFNNDEQEEVMLNDVMDFKEAGKRTDAIITKWNKSKWEDSDFIEKDADISNKDILALLIAFTEMRHVVYFARDKIRYYRGAILKHGQHLEDCKYSEGECTCGLQDVIDKGKHKKSCMDEEEWEDIKAKLIK
jgi:hypothetical protein